jgi:hypothetical protein
MRFPTGRWDDPNNLVDAPTGFAAWGLGLQAHQDVLWCPPGTTLTLGVLPPGAVRLSTTFRYEAILPDTKPFRVCSIHQPCVHFDPDVHRDVGDIVEAELGGTVGLPLSGLTFTSVYTYTYKFQDTFRGDLGFDYRQLQRETDAATQGIEVRLASSTARLYAAQRFPVPVSVAVRYAERIASNNNRGHTQYLGVLVDVSF